MNANEPVVYVVLILAVVATVVAIAALFRFGAVKITIKAFGAVFELDGHGFRRDSGEKEAGAAPPSRSRGRILWLKIFVPLVFILVFVLMPWWWWHVHSTAWKIALSNHVSRAWSLTIQKPKERIYERQDTLYELTKLFDGYANDLGRNGHRRAEVWIVNHFWQYWATDAFNDYARANRRFVDSGGKIHRMFILSGKDLEEPNLKTVVRNQCENIGADVWVGSAATIQNKAEYRALAAEFRHLPDTDNGFEAFDVLQLEDLTYYSSDFSPDYRAIRSSTWFYGQTADLRSLFNQSVAQRIDCAEWSTPQSEAQRLWPEQAGSPL